MFLILGRLRLVILLLVVLIRDLYIRHSKDGTHDVIGKDVCFRVEVVQLFVLALAAFSRLA